MNRFPVFSIRRQLILMTVGLLFVLAYVSYLAANLYGHRAARLSYDRLLAGAALHIAESVRYRNGDISIDLPWSAFETLALAPDDRVFYGIYGEQGELITGYDGLADLEPDTGSISSLEVGVSLPVSFYDANYKDEKVRFITLDQVLKDVGLTQTVNIRIGQTVRARELLAADISFKALQFISMFIVIALVLIVFGIWLLLRPLRILNLALQQRSPVDLHPLEVSVPTEIQPLMKTINHFMSQLGTTLNGLKRFTSEAAHQIRTPLAGLKSQAQNALIEENPNLRQEQLNRVLESCDLLTDTVSQLLNQATIAHRFQSQEFQWVRLDSIVKEICREIAVSALSNDVEVAYSGSIGYALHGDNFALKQMIRNIMENAIKYSPKHGIVEVELAISENNNAILRVRDSGPGIPDDEKEQVFEQFYRSPNNTRVGSGLGLSIAREIAIHHRASFHLKDNFPQGLLMEIHFSQGDIA